MEENHLNNDTLAICVKVESDINNVIKIKEEPIENDHQENITEFVAVDIKTEDPCFDEETVTEDDAISYMLSNAFETEFVDTGPEHCEIKSEIFIKSEISDQNEILPIDTKTKTRLKSISFSKAVAQAEKRYQIKLKFNQNDFKDYYILTSGIDENNTGTCWKLLIPATSSPLIAQKLIEVDVDYDSRGDRFNFSYNSTNMIVKHVQDLSTFMQGVNGGKNLLLTQNNFQSIMLTFSSDQELKTNANHVNLNDHLLVPTFTVSRDQNVFIFPVRMEDIGEQDVDLDAEATAVGGSSQLLVLTTALFRKPSLSINGVPYQISPYQQGKEARPNISTNSVNIMNGGNRGILQISDIKAKYESGQHITDEELDPLIKVLESKIMKTAAEKKEIKRLKTRRRNRKCRQKMTEEQREALKKQVRDQKRENYHKMSEEEKEVRRKHARVQKRMRYHQMTEEQKEVLRKRVREQKREQYQQMSDQQKEAVRKRNREQKKARSFETSSETNMNEESADLRQEDYL